MAWKLIILKWLFFHVFAYAILSTLLTPYFLYSISIILEARLKFRGQAWESFSKCKVCPYISEGIVFSLFSLLKDLSCICFKVKVHVPIILCRVFNMACDYETFLLFIKYYFYIKFNEFFYFCTTFHVLSNERYIKGLYKTPKGQVHLDPIKGFSLTSRGYLWIVTSKTILSSKTDYPRRFLLGLPRLGRIGFLSQGPKGEEVEIHKVRNLLVRSVVRSICVKFSWNR